MKKTLITIGLLVNCLLLFAQGNKNPKFSSDEDLKALAAKNIKTPVSRIVKPNGDIFLQRDMTDALRQRLRPAIEPMQPDHGDDHNSDQLVAFLNRPHPSVATMEKYFSEAAAEFNVPVDLLKSIGQVQSNWAQVPASMYGSWGVMGLIDNRNVDQIGEAALLLRLTKDDIKQNAQANIRAAAALLAKYQQPAGYSTELQDWFDAVKKLTGLPQDVYATMLANDIYRVLNEGAKSVTNWGEVINIPATPTGNIFRVVPDVPGSQSAAPDHPGVAVSRACSTNYGLRTDTTRIRFYFIHYIGTGTYAGTISWFQDCSSIVSAHYVVRNHDGFITQMVDEKDRAFSQGVNLYNQEGIGVEHEAIVTNLMMWESEPLLDSASALAREVCTRRNIPKIRRPANGDPGIYGHSDVRSTDCPNLTPERWQNLLNRIADRAVPGQPVLYTISSPAGGGGAVSATWKQSADAELVGYRLYYATSDNLQTWKLAADESTLTNTVTSVTLQPANFIDPPAGPVYHFKLAAVADDGAGPLEGFASDIYSRSVSATGSKVLIVDGFDRYTVSASYRAPTHNFTTKYFNALRDRGTLQISSAANEKVEDGTVNLSDYDIVVWYVGDEASADVVLSTAEKNAFKSFMDGGGKMLFTGSEISYMLARSGTSTTDQAFTSNYLKHTYVADGATNYTPVTGIDNTVFSGITLPLGVTYPEDYPDAIAPVTGATAVFDYFGVNYKGGVVYKGRFGTGTVAGALVFLSFALETTNDAGMSLAIGRTLKYFDETVQAIAPVAVNDVFTAYQGINGVINVLNNDNANDTTLNLASVQIISGPAHGTAVVDSMGAIVYRSTAGYTGTDQITYRVSNTAGQVSNVATVSITVKTYTSSGCEPSTRPEATLEHPKKELRGVWVSTVSNLDWPSSRTLTTAAQKAELVKILDTLAKNRINTVYLQVRTSGDALYNSSIEPWSHWLTGVQGQAPNPLWDPLQFAVEEAHKRGLQLHAWINPFRAKKYTAAASNHVAVLHPEWLLVSGADTILNPGLPAVRDYVTQIVSDIANRYDVDGIHFDDYFYSYNGTTTQDTAAFRLYNPNNITDIKNWRRNNTTVFIQQIFQAIKSINLTGNRNIVFGVSPFGIWKSGVPTGISGTSSYNDLYYDPIDWMQKGIVDYVAPQLYWRITGPQDYSALAKWWNDQAALYNRHIYVGQAWHRLDPSSSTGNWNVGEIQNQIAIDRDAANPNIKGQIGFRYVFLNNNVKGLKTVLYNDEYAYRSYAPPMPWMDNVCPLPPVNVRIDGDSLRWDRPAAATDGDEAKRFVVYAFTDLADAANFNDGRKVYAITPNNAVVIPVSDGIVSGRTIPSNSILAVSSLDDNNNESDLTLVATALPVTGIDLEVNLTGNKSVLHWFTLKEANTSHFEIERSVDGATFIKVGTHAAAGHSNSRRDYYFEDYLQADGDYYYRIKAVDLDGKHSYSPVRMASLHGSLTVGIAPNPFKETFTVSNLGKASSMELYDNAGRLMFKQNITQRQSVEVYASRFSPGVYTLKVITGGKTSQTIRLLKQ